MPDPSEPGDSVSKVAAEYLVHYFGGRIVDENQQTLQAVRRYVLDSVYGFCHTLSVLGLMDWRVIDEEGKDIHIG